MRRPWSSGYDYNRCLERLNEASKHGFLQLEDVATRENNSLPSYVVPKTNSKNRTFNLGPAYVTNFVYKNKKIVKKSSREPPIFIGPTLFHWDGSYFTYHSFFSHVKARLQTDVKCVEIRIGSDDEGGLTKAIDKVFPNATRLLCTKHIKDNVTDYVKNKLPMTKEQRTTVMSRLFGDDGISMASDSTDFNAKSLLLCNEFPLFADYYNKRRKTRLLNYVNIPSRRCHQYRLWTNNNCESMNHRFKLATDWKPQALPDLINSIYDVVRLHFVDMRRALYGHGNYELEENFKRHYVTYNTWTVKPDDEKDKLFLRFLKDFNFDIKLIESSDGRLIIPHARRLARKPGQKQRPKTNDARTLPRYII